jgi:hypothetical protein
MVQDSSVNDSEWVVYVDEHVTESILQPHKSHTQSNRSLQIDGKIEKFTGEADLQNSTFLKLIREAVCFTKISYCDNDERLSRAGFKTRSDLEIRERYHIYNVHYPYAVLCWGISTIFSCLYLNLVTKGISRAYNEYQSYGLLRYGYNVNPAYVIFAKGKEFNVAFRGTQDRYDLVADVNVTWTKLYGGSVHSGFYQQFECIKKSLICNLELYARESRVKIEDLQVNLTGHSLGGAIAQITALFLKTEYNVRDLRVITFGSPSVFDDKGGKVYDAVLKESSYRMVHRSDLVSSMPATMLGYVHVGKEFSISLCENIPTLPKDQDSSYLMSLFKHMTSAVSLLLCAKRNHSIDTYFRAIHNEEAKLYEDYILDDMVVISKADEGICHNRVISSDSTAQTHQPGDGVLPRGTVHIHENTGSCAIDNEGAKLYELVEDDGLCMIATMNKHESDRCAIDPQCHQEASVVQSMHGLTNTKDAIPVQYVNNDSLEADEPGNTMQTMELIIKEHRVDGATSIMSDEPGQQNFNEALSSDNAAIIAEHESKAEIDVKSDAKDSIVKHEKGVEGVFSDMDMNVNRGNNERVQACTNTSTIVYSGILVPSKNRIDENQSIRYVHTNAENIALENVPLLCALSTSNISRLLIKGTESVHIMTGKTVQANSHALLSLSNNEIATSKLEAGRVVKVSTKVASCKKDTLKGVANYSVQYSERLRKSHRADVIAKPKEQIENVCVNLEINSACNNHQRVEECINSPVSEHSSIAIKNKDCSDYSQPKSSNGGAIDDSQKDAIKPAATLINSEKVNKYAEEKFSVLHNRPYCESQKEGSAKQLNKAYKLFAGGAVICVAASIILAIQTMFFAMCAIGIVSILCAVAAYYVRPQGNLEDTHQDMHPVFQNVQLKR